MLLTEEDKLELDEVLRPRLKELIELKLKLQRELADIHYEMARITALLADSE